MKTFLRQAALAAMLMIAVCCRNGGGTAASSDLGTRRFPEVQVPAMYTDPASVLDFVTTHFWDRYLDASQRYLCDSSHVAGVESREFASQLASFLSILENNCTLDQASRVMELFFDKITEYQRADTTSNLFSTMTSAVSYYLYDPNSDIRCEDLYLPFVRGLSTSEFVEESLRPSYQSDVAMCSLNQGGTRAADFVYEDAAGRRHRMYDTRADYTVLTFVNPGCKACGEVVETFSDPFVTELIGQGRLAVLDIYIDEDLDSWRAHSGDIPQTWISGFDPTLIIRKDLIYNVRAIPSIYLLDSDKRVILKDAPAQKVLAYLQMNN